jgi:nitrilase
MNAAKGNGLSRRFKVAAAQLTGSFFQTDRDIARICVTLREAAGRGIRLVVFPESFVGGYPYWRGHATVRQEAELAARLHEAAVRVDGPEVGAIADACVQHGIAAVVGVNERDDRPGSETTFNTLLFFHPATGYAGRHRKLIPTHTERAYWGRGEREDLRVFDFPFGRVGGLICYEHHMLLSRMALAVMGEEIHCAAWPGYWETGDHIADKKPGPAGRHGEIDAVVRDYAMSTQSFVVSANALIDPDSVPDDLRGIVGYNLARGGSAVVDPSGRYLAGPMLDEEGLVEAEIDMHDRTLCKSYLDTVGHYARWDVFQFELRDSPGSPAFAVPAGGETRCATAPDTARHPLIREESSEASD